MKPLAFAPKLVDDPHERAAAFILRDLLRAGWKVRLAPPEVGDDPRASIREQMDGARREKLAEHASFMGRMVRGGVKALLADGPVDGEVRPRMQCCRGPARDDVTGLPLTAIFRWMRLRFWANPYERPPGRALTYLIRDDARPMSPVMGLLQLSSPTLQIACREAYIGWPSRERKTEVVGRNLLEASTVGAVPPYGEVRAGKLAALLALSDRVRDDWKGRYGDEAVYVGTSSIYGVEPNQYTRCALPGGPRWRKVGTTEGWGWSQTFGEETVGAIEPLLDMSRDIEGGASPKFRMVRKGLLETVGEERFMRHGVRRIVYAAVLARNGLEWLRGEAETLDPFDPWKEERVIDYWKRRWAKHE